MTTHVAAALIDYTSPGAGESDAAAVIHRAVRAAGEPVVIQQNTALVSTQCC